MPASNKLIYHIHNRMRTALLVLALYTSLLAACVDPYQLDDQVPDPVPGDLRVRHEPNDTVRVGTTVRFTAVFADSLNAAAYRIVWNFGGNQGGPGRTIEWTAPSTPGTYDGEVHASRGEEQSAVRHFVTVVVP